MEQGGVFQKKITSPISKTNIFWDTLYLLRVLRNSFGLTTSWCHDLFQLRSSIFMQLKMTQTSAALVNILTGQRGFTHCLKQRINGELMHCSQVSRSQTFALRTELRGWSFYLFIHSFDTYTRSSYFQFSFDYTELPIIIAVSKGINWTLFFNGWWAVLDTLELD